MNVLILIMWYLQLLTPSTNYSTTEMNLMLEQNKATIQEFQNNQVLMEAAYQKFKASSQKGLIEEWGNELPDPILD